MQVYISFVVQIQQYYVLFKKITIKYIHFYTVLCLNQHHEANKAWSMTDEWNWNLNVNKMQLFTILGLGDTSSAFYDEVILSSQIKQ